MDIVTGALDSVLSKLAEFLKDEYNLQTGVREKIQSLSGELERMHAALRMVAGVPPDELDELAKLWARDVRELSYTVEDILDTFLVRVEAGRKRKDPDMKWYQHAAAKIVEVFSQAKARRDISSMIDVINEKAKEVAKRRERYKVDDLVVAKPDAKNTVDPRLKLIYGHVTQLIGIDKSRGELNSMVQQGDHVSILRTVSIVGVGGLGKTTLAKASYDELESSYDYSAFVSVGQNPDLSKVFKDILFNLNKTKYEHIHNTGRGVDLLISELQEFLKNKRYFIVIDDIWEPQSWAAIKMALVGNNCGSRIIITTRKQEVAEEVDEVYRLQPLSDDNPKKLFYARLFGGEDKCPTNHPDDLSNAILKKCGGVPLAIITMASFLLGKSTEEWCNVRDCPGFCQDNNNDRHMKNTMHILSLSYYDLPSQLKTCLLYLSVFPEDTLIDKVSLIWMWIAEGFVEKKPGHGLFEVGEEYFHDLINRNMIQGVDSEVYGIMDGCRVHDMVLDLMVSMSSEENFVIADRTLSETNTRRLAFKKRRELNLTQDTTHVNLPQVRSFIVWLCAIDNNKWTLHPRLKLIRVLALELCKFRGDGHNLEPIGNLVHLRYLAIRETLIEGLPEGIGALMFLQTLDLENDWTYGYDLALPCSIGRLTQLVCLRASKIIVPDKVLGKLISLEELQILGPHNNGESWTQFAKDLGNLLELRVLKIGNDNSIVTDEGVQKDFVQSLGNLKKMQHLTLSVLFLPPKRNAWDAAVPPRGLRCLFLSHNIFLELPSWINSAHLPSLSHLEIHVCCMDEQGLKALGGLPELCYLKLDTGSEATINSSNTEADGCFHKLRSLVLPDSIVQFVANEDSSAWCVTIRPVSIHKDDSSRVGPAIVMPNLEELEFHAILKDLIQNNVSCEDLGLEYLPTLRKVKVWLSCVEASEDELEREEAALRHAIEVHPNLPALQIEYTGKRQMKRPDDGGSVQPRDEEEEEDTQ